MTLSRVHWRDILLVLLLVLLDICVNPLTIGPDRLVHDPAVYRLWSPNYMSGDWYTGMAVASGVYTFYAPLVNLWHSIHIPEELWRMSLYLASLIVLYYFLVRISRLFTQSPFVAPGIALLHATLCTGIMQPLWLYGPFIQIDGGLAPRSIGVALSFASLFFLIQEKVLIAAALMGIATLVHVSNSLIVFTLFLGAWTLQAVLARQGKPWRTIGIQVIKTSLIYLVSGGWFALYVASHGKNDLAFSTQQFIWTWINFRASYMHLPSAPMSYWVVALVHLIALIGGWLILRKRAGITGSKKIDLLAMIGLGSVVYFCFFYLIAFIWPWLPGFQFYSIRVIYLGYFVTYLFIALTVISYTQKVLMTLRRSGNRRSKLLVATIILSIGLGGTIAYTYLAPRTQPLQQVANDLLTSWRQLQANKLPLPPPPHETLTYLATYQQPFLGPPNLQAKGYYLPNIVSFKSFGFTIEGLPEWFQRINDVSQGKLQQLYEEQRDSANFHAATIDWVNSYTALEPATIVALANKYQFNHFLTFSTTSYPFKLIAEDSDFRLYQLP